MDRILASAFAGVFPPAPLDHAVPELGVFVATDGHPARALRLLAERVPDRTTLKLLRREDVIFHELPEKPADRVRQDAWRGGGRYLREDCPDAELALPLTLKQLCGVVDHVYALESGAWRRIGGKADPEAEPNMEHVDLEGVEDWRRGDVLLRHAVERKSRLAARVLRELGYKRATLEYDGSGDSGSVEDVELHPGDAAADLPKVVEEEFCEVFRDLAYEGLGRAFGGWEINEGSFGEVTVDFESLRCDIDHNWRVEATEHDSSSFAFENEEGED